jgi:1-phosphofructokinase family hexose kinase
MIAVAALSPALDVSYVVDDLVLGEPHRPTSVVRVAGGKALNSARAAVRLGAAVTAVPVLGGHLGGLVAALLDADGVTAEIVESPTETRQCVSIASAAGGTLTEIYERPVALGDDELSQVLEGLERVAGAGSWVSLSGGLPTGAEPVLGDIARLCAAKGARLALDTHGPALRSVLGSFGVGLLKVNRAEAAEALDLPLDVELSSLVSALREAAGSDVVVTDGAHGSIAADASGLWRVALPPAAGSFGAYPVGSGDSYLGGLLAALDSGVDLPAAVALAAGAATANALVPGAAVFDASVARSLAARVVVTPLAARSPDLLAQL